MKALPCASYAVACALHTLSRWSKAGLARCPSCLIRHVLGNALAWRDAGPRAAGTALGQYGVRNSCHGCQRPALARQSRV